MLSNYPIKSLLININNPRAF